MSGDYPIFEAKNSFTGKVIRQMVDGDEGGYR